eukprot:COSAG02_NODE_47661_length_339_cov_1.300000_1_plen_26_part_10
MVNGTGEFALFPALFHNVCAPVDEQC